MSWIRSSDPVVAVVFLALVVGAAGTAVALSVNSSGVPSDSKVGTKANGTIIVEDPFTESPNEWTLTGETDMENVSWTVTVLDQGRQVSQETYAGQSFEQTLSRSAGGDEIRIVLNGTAPSIQNYTYDPRETYTFATLTRVRGNSSQEIQTWDVNVYTNASMTAREAIEEADDAIEEAGGNEEAEGDLQQAISAYNSGNFQNAISNANDARETAQQAQQSQQTTQTLLFGGVGVVVLLVIVGGVWYYRQQQDDYDKLR